MHSDITAMMILLLMLYVINVLPLIYIFSFIKAKLSVLVKLLIFLPITTVVIEVAMDVLGGSEFTLHQFTLRYFQKKVVLLLPYTSFLYAQVAFYTTSLRNSRCKKLSNQYYDSNCDYKISYCCKLNCYDGQCQKRELYSSYTYRDIIFQEGICYLCMMPIIYFGILAILESRLIQKVKSKLTTQYFAYFPANEQVMREKSMIYQAIQALNRSASASKLRGNQVDCSNNKAYMAYELRKFYKKVKAVEDVSFSVNRQECFGILGVNRAGKSVTLQMMAGEVIPDHGIFLMDDQLLSNDTRSLLSQIGYCPQQEAIIKCLNTYDHLRLVARLRGVPENQVKNEVNRWIHTLNLRACASLPCSAYSNGNKQRLNIAMAFIGNPKLILLDEPTIRIDPEARRCFWNTVKNCQAAGQTIVLATHNMQECEALCNRMTIMVEGKLTCFGTPEELKQHFGAGYDVQIRMDPKKTSSQLNEIKNAMRLLLPCILNNETTSSLMYYVSGPGTTWSRLYDILDKMKNKYECIDDYIVIVRLST